MISFQNSLRAGASPDVEAALSSRFSARAFLPQQVERATIERVLRAAMRTPPPVDGPSPWKVYVLQGAARDTLVDKVVAAHDALRANPELAARYREEYDYYPERWVSPYIDRRRENGWSLYGLLGITKGDKDRMHAQHQRNYRFFDAPIGLMFTIEREKHDRMLDCGMFLQGVMVAARAEGLHTCPQAAWNGFASIILPHIGAREHELLVCGMALGRADPAAPVNGFQTPRESVDAFTRWLE